MGCPTMCGMPYHCRMPCLERDALPGAGCPAWCRMPTLRTSCLVLLPQNQPTTQSSSPSPCVLRCASAERAGLGCGLVLGQEGRLEGELC